MDATFGGTQLVVEATALHSPTIDSDTCGWASRIASVLAVSLASLRIFAFRATGGLRYTDSEFSP